MEVEKPLWFLKRAATASKHIKLRDEIKTYLESYYQERRAYEEELKKQNVEISEEDNDIPTFLRRKHDLENTYAIKEMIDNKENPFSIRLKELIAESGLTDPEVYNKAAVDRKLFSKIRIDSDYKPSKNTILAFVFALELSYEGAIELLKTVGYTLSDSLKFDLIIRYLLENEIYDTILIDDILIDFDECTLFY